MEKYEVLEHVGKGSFGAVTKIRRKNDNKILVWKEISYGKMKEKEKQQLVSEVNILRELRHTHIVKYYDRIIDKVNSKIFIVMEYCERGDLGQVIKKCKRENDFLSEDVIWKIFMQVLLALQACHNREAGKILHRDIKPGNVLLDSNMNVKLGDFGLSRILGENSIYAETRVGTPYYMSPEQITDSRYNEKSDIWSAGCLLFEMASLNPPFQATSHAELARKINLGQIERIPLRYSEELQRVASWMLAVDCNLRPKVDDILNLPQVSLRVKEKQLRDETQKLKEYEAKLKDREEKAKNEKEQLFKREDEIIIKEKKHKESIKAKENYKIKEKAFEDLIFEDKKNYQNEEITGVYKEKTLESPENYLKTDKKYEIYTYDSDRHLKKENSFDYPRKEPEKQLKRENTYESFEYERRKSIENTNPNDEKVIKKEKSFENLVQEGLERAKRDNNMLKIIENSKKESPSSKPITRPSPNRISHNNSAPDIPKSKPSIKESPSAANIDPYPKNPEKMSPYLREKNPRNYEDRKTENQLFKEIKERYNPNTQKTKFSPSNNDKKESPMTRYSPLSKNYEKRENSLTYESPGHYLLNRTKESPLEKYLQTRTSAERTRESVERTKESADRIRESAERRRDSAERIRDSAERMRYPNSQRNKVSPSYYDKKESPVTRYSSKNYEKRENSSTHDSPSHCLLKRNKESPSEKYLRTRTSDERTRDLPDRRRDSADRNRDSAERIRGSPVTRYSPVGKRLYNN